MSTSRASRLSPAGQIALAAERGDLAPVPLGLINGNVHRYGSRPAFRPQAIIEALRQVIQRPAITSGELTDIIGPPHFLNGCLVTGDFAALSAGRPTEVRLQARVTVSDDRGSVLVTNFPPIIDPDEIARSLADLARARHWARKHPDLHRRVRLPVSDVRDESPHPRDADLIACVPEEGTTAEQLRDQLIDVYGVSVTVPVALPRPLATMIRGWAQAYRSEDLPASLTALENAIRIQPACG